MRIVYSLVGFISLTLGIIGIVLPILPTTPFLLLTLYCFSKTSPRFHHWFTQSKLYKKYLANLVETRSMKRIDKIKLMLFVDLVLLITIIIMQNWIITISLIVLDCLKYAYFTTQIKSI